MEDKEAESCVLATLISNPDSQEDILSELSEGEFSNERNRRVFRVILKLHQEGKPVELVSVGTEVRNVGVETAYVMELVDGFTSLNPSYYVDRIKSANISKKLGDILLTATAKNDPKTVKKLIDEIDQSLYGLTNGHSPSTVVRLGDTMPDYYKLLETRAATPGAKGIRTGFDKFDELTGGFQPSELAIIAARPGAGKSAWGINIIEQVSLAKGLGSIFFSVEMSKEQVRDRITASQTGIDLQRLNRGHIKQEEWKLIAEATGRMESAPFWLDDTANLNLAEMRAKIRKINRKSPVSLVIIDYLQLLKGSRESTREGEIAEISRGLKSIAKEFRIPVVALAQLNREVESRNPPIPRLSDLRESGQIEQDADLICFIFRRDAYERDRAKHDGRAMLIVAKNRQGPLGNIYVGYKAPLTKFVNE